MGYPKGIHLTYAEPWGSGTYHGIILVHFMSKQEHRQHLLHRMRLYQGPNIIWDPVISYLKKYMSLGAYAALSGEVPVWDIMRTYKNPVSLPCIQGQTMVMRQMTCDTPLEKDSRGFLYPAHGRVFVPECLLIPCVAVSSQGQRLGRGGGFYDRYLAQYRGHRIGVVWQWQHGCTFPIEKWDMPLDAGIIIDDQGCIEIVHWR